MKYVRLGNSDLKVSKICLGCMGFGEAERGMHFWTLALKESKEIIKYALDSGINFFDTAMSYQGGTSEEFLGQAIREYGVREEEREMAVYCKEENIAMTPYSALASGRLSKHPGEDSKRLREDQFAKGKYDSSEKDDMKIIKRVEELALKKGVSMTEISLSWLMSKTTSPVVGVMAKK
ncbi:MAG: aldo/keto reductase [Clostridium sp.]|nr:aldo/keto reductase [Clostridium sp.]